MMYKNKKGLLFFPFKESVDKIEGLYIITGFETYVEIGDLTAWMSPKDAIIAEIQDYEKVIRLIFTVPIHDERKK